MTAPSVQTDSRNRLLRAMRPDDFDAIVQVSDVVDLAHRDCLAPPGRPCTHVYFPESGIASVTLQSEPMRVEIGLIGREGFVGITALLGDGISPHGSFVQLPGRYVRVPVDAFRAAVGASAPLRAMLMRYVQVYIVQVSSTASANGTFTVEQRLARWILMAQDRSDGHELALTHDFLSLMLGVRRPGVTVATHVLEGEHAIRATRGQIVVTNRETLVALSKGSYGMAEAEYERLLGA